MIGDIKLILDIKFCLDFWWAMFSTFIYGAFNNTESFGLQWVLGVQFHRLEITYFLSGTEPATEHTTIITYN